MKSCVFCGRFTSFQLLVIRCNLLAACFSLMWSLFSSSYRHSLELFRFFHACHVHVIALYSQYREHWKCKITCSYCTLDISSWCYTHSPMAYGYMHSLHGIFVGFIHSTKSDKEKEAICYFQIFLARSSALNCCFLHFCVSRFIRIWFAGLNLCIDKCLYTEIH